SPPQYIVILAGDHVYKMDYSIMLADHADSGRGVTVGCIEVPRDEASAFGVMAVNDQRHVTDFIEKPADPPAMPGNPDMALASMGIYVFTADYLYRLLEDDARDPESTHDFGRDLIPRAVAENQAFAHPFSLSAIATPPFSGPYWRDVGTVDAYWAANLDLASTTPALNMYDKDWPIWTYQEQLPPAKFVHDLEGRRGEAVDSLVSGGCIVSGSLVRNSVLFSNVLVRSYSVIEGAVVLPDVQINRHCRLTKVVIDRHCQIPAGLVIGEDPELDAQRFYRSETGVVLVTQAMLAAL
ncbi:MAG: glucose-1-phosphate adenylyltransferase, partial [Betaproteobacteria bacterium HGW-Betaproteobacteria-21]